MAKVKIQGNASGTGILTVTAPNTSTDRTITLPDSTGTLSVDKSITDNGNATAMTIGADENIGIGVVPKAWHSSGVALQVGAGGCVKGHTTDERVALLSNAYEAASDGNWKRVLTGLAANVNIDNGVVNFETAVTGSADSNITWTNPVQIDSEGIKFNGDTAAANALDDYEEGSFTPVFTGSSGSAGSYDTGEHEARYTKIGRLVTIQFKITLTNKGSWGGEVRFTTLPFSVSDTMPATGSVTLAYVDVPGDASNHNVYVTSGVTYWRVQYTTDNNATSMVLLSETANNAVFAGTFTYTTNA